MPATFAILHDIPDPALARLSEAVPDVRFITGKIAGPLPEGIEQATGAAVPNDDGRALDALLERAPGLKWLQARGTGIEPLLTPAVRASGVAMTNASGNHSINIAEHVLGMMLAFARQFPVLMLNQQARRWGGVSRAKLFELHGQTLAIVGLGDIGRTVAPLAAAFGMQVVGVRRSAGGELPPGVSRVAAMADLDEVMAAADHVLLTLPHTPETEGMFGADRFRAMRRGAYFYNIGRGPTVDHAALAEALASGHLGGAGLDVTEPEPLPAESPLWQDPNVIITSHTSGMTPKSFERYLPLLTANLQRWRKGESLLNVVDLKRGY